MMRYALCLFALLCGHAVAAGATEPPVIGGLERAGAEKIAGAVLVSELAFAAKGGPDLSAVGARVNGAHLRRYFASPSRVKPGTTMPDLLAHLTEAERADAANALADYLASLGGPHTRPVITAAEVAPDGMSVRLRVRGLMQGHVHDFHLPASKSRERDHLLHDRAYYTLNEIPNT
jgi:hypothetical protein